MAISEVSVSTGTYNTPLKHKAQCEINMEPSMTDETGYEPLELLLSRFEHTNTPIPLGQYDGDDMEFTEYTEPSHESVKENQAGQEVTPNPGIPEQDALKAGELAGIKDQIQ